VRRTKEMLSANSAAPMTVEELHEGLDYAASLKREELEAMVAPLLARAAAPLTRLLARAGLAGSEVDAVELLGGGSRVPALQAALSAALGGRGLDRCGRRRCRVRLRPLSLHCPRFPPFSLLACVSRA